MRTYKYQENTRKQETFKGENLLKSEVLSMYVHAATKQIKFSSQILGVLAALT